MKGFGVPELVIVAGLMLVLLAGFVPSGTIEKQKENLLFSQKVGALGAGTYDYKHIPLADELLLSKGIEGTPLYEQAGPLEVARGVITSEEHLLNFNIPESTVSQLDSLSLSFDVLETNRYGPLKVELNGHEVVSEYLSPGDFRVTLPLEYIRPGENSVRILAGSSGWRLWSPTYYVIKNVRIKEAITPEEERTFSFQLSEEELNSLDKVRIAIGSIDASLEGDLAIILNGERIVFEGIPGRATFSPTFSSGLRQNNTITFKLLEDGSYAMRNVKLVLFLLKGGRGGFSKEFHISEEDLALMREGKEEGVVELEVKSTDDAPLRVVLEGEVPRTLYEGTPERGTLVLRFSGSEATTTNTLRISSAGDYYLGDVSVKLVMK